MYVPDDDNYEVDGENYAPPRPPEEREEKNKKEKIKKIVIIIVAAIIIGLLVYFISGLFFNSKPKEQPKSAISTTLSVDDPEVENIYEMVTYGRDSKTLNKYLKEQFVSLKDFSNYEKFYYALSNLRSRDLEEEKDDDTTDSSTKKYYIPDDVMDNLMKDYFGDDVTYLKQGTIPVTLGNPIDEGNALTLTYNVNQEQYEVTFQNQAPTADNTIPVALYDLESASRGEDGTITLVERVVYLTGSVSNNLVSYQVYRDANHTMLISSVSNIELAKYNEDPVTIDDFLEQSNIITYKFKEDKGEYYFYQSKIEQ